MNISKNLTRRHLTVTALVMGMSFPLYAMADTPPAADTTKVVTQTTTTKTVIHHKHHSNSAAAKANKADAVNNANALNAEANANSANTDTSNSDKGVVWKNGVVFHDVEPTAQALKDAPTSTSDTLKGGVTSTIGQ